MNHISDLDDISRARKLNRLVQNMPLDPADKRVLSAGLVAFIEAYHEGARPIVSQDPQPQGTGFASLGQFARSLL